MSYSIDLSGKVVLVTGAVVGLVDVFLRLFRRMERMLQ